MDVHILSVIMEDCNTEPSLHLHVPEPVALGQLGTGAGAGAEMGTVETKASGPRSKLAERRKRCRTAVLEQEAKIHEELKESRDLY